MKDIQQLIKKNSQEGRYEDIFPKTFIDAVSNKVASVRSYWDVYKGAVHYPIYLENGNVIDKIN